MTVVDPHARAEVVARDKRRVWHPYTPMKQYVEEGAPLVIARAEGPYLWDADGRRFIDGNASWWTCALGHRHPRLMARLRAQSETLCHVAFAGVTHAPAAALAEALGAVAPPGLGRVFFSDDGSTAVEVALKLSLQLHHNEGRPERRAFVALADAFHGETLGVTGLGGVEVFRRPFSKATLPCHHVPRPPRDDTDPGFASAVDALRQTLEAHGETIAAVVLEPCVQGAAGMRMYAPGYLRACRSLCDTHGVMMIADEVFTGYGRTGPMWACAHADVAPDMLCTAKAFTGGVLPMAATLTNERVFSAFLGAKERAFYYGHTFCGHALGAAIATEVLDVYRDEGILARAEPKAARIADAVDRLERRRGLTGGRALGMIGAVDFEGGSGYLGERGWRVYDEALKRGAYLRPLGDTIYVTPPLNIDDEALDALLKIVEESVDAVLAEGPDARGARAWRME
ncbi:MAG: adenosylmethionine--8-amino-7-oxononanoate transaminase [Myxococcota bacterium]